MNKIKRASEFKAASLLMVLMFVTAGCTQAADAGKRKPIYQDTPGLTELPERIPVKKWDKGTIVAVEQGTQVPFSGILMIEPRAVEAGEVRIAYDKLYAIADINRKLTVAVVKVADRQLEDADKQIDQLRAKNNSWWTRNSLSIGVVGGFVIGVSLTGLVVWGISKAVK